MSKEEKRLREQNRELNLALDASFADVLGLRRELATAKNHAATLDGDRDRMRYDLGNVRREIQTLKAENAHLIEGRNEYVAERDQLRAELASARAAMEACVLVLTPGEACGGSGAGPCHKTLAFVRAVLGGT